jgi:uncharacterized membrane protein YdfJ with MMPL/SSD domain
MPRRFAGLVAPARGGRGFDWNVQDFANFGVILLFLVFFILIIFVFVFVVLAVLALIGLHLYVLVFVFEVFVIVFRPKLVLETHELLLSDICSLRIQMMQAAK